MFLKDVLTRAEFSYLINNIVTYVLQFEVNVFNLNIFGNIIYSCDGSWNLSNITPVSSVTVSVLKTQAHVLNSQTLLCLKSSDSELGT